MLAYPDWGSAIVGKELCRLWSAASSAEKQRYERLADADKASYEQMRVMRGPGAEIAVQPCQDVAVCTAFTFALARVPAGCSLAARGLLSGGQRAVASASTNAVVVISSLQRQAVSARLKPQSSWHHAPAWASMVVCFIVPA